MKVLLVDDEQELVSALCERLELRDIETDYALNGNDAIKLAKEKEYDVAVLDVMMPNMNGLELMTHLKGISPGIQVILLTGRGSVEESKEGLKKGAFDYLIKPVNIKDLIVLLEKAVKKPDE